MSEGQPAAPTTADEAVAASLIPGDSKPDQGAASLGVYVTKPSDYPHSPSKLLLLLTNGTGIRSANNQLQADKFAKEGFLVVMPDQFEGEPAPNSKVDATTAAESQPTVIEQMKLGAAETIKSFQLDMWLARHTPEKVVPRLHRVINSIKEEYADALAYGGGLYAVGYCFGARYVLILAAGGGGAAIEMNHPDGAQPGTVPDKPAPLIKVGAIAHGTLVTKEELQDVAAPMCLVCVENDSLFPTSILEEGVNWMKQNGLKHEVHTFSDVPHGFAVLGDYDDGKIVEKQTDAFGRMLAFLQSE